MARGTKCVHKNEKKNHLFQQLRRLATKTPLGNIASPPLTRPQTSTLQPSGRGKPRTLISTDSYHIHRTDKPQFRTIGGHSAAQAGIVSISEDLRCLTEDLRSRHARRDGEVSRGEVR